MFARGDRDGRKRTTTSTVAEEEKQPSNTQMGTRKQRTKPRPSLARHFEVKASAEDVHRVSAQRNLDVDGGVVRLETGKRIVDHFVWGAIFERFHLHVDVLGGQNLECLVE
eukprot:m.137260 g.137260  ORF g.137260 m.137260 type:complete len:111 (+) comp9926_c0_seq2:1879-2211(+)